MNSQTDEVEQLLNLTAVNTGDAGKSKSSDKYKLRYFYTIIV
jgi:hypothetical protein